MGRITASKVSRCCAATKDDYKDFMERKFKTWLPQPVAGVTRTQCDDRIREIEAESAIQAHKSRVYLKPALNLRASDGRHGMTVTRCLP